MNEDLLTVLMTDLDPVRDLTDGTVNELVPTEHLMSKVLSKIEQSAPPAARIRTSIWHRASLRVGAVAAAAALVATGAIAFLDSAPSPVTGGFALGAVHSSWVQYNTPAKSDYTGYDTVTPNLASLIVTKGRISTVLHLSGLTITPPPANIKPKVSSAQMASRLWATTSLQGQTEVAFGIGSITLASTRPRSPSLRDVPVWVAIATSVPCGSANACDTASALTSRPLTVVINGYGLPNSSATTGTPIAFSYPITDGPGAPVFRPAIEQVSVSWNQDGQVSNGKLRITATPVPCGALVGYSLTKQSGGTMLTVKGLVPESTIGDYCTASFVTTKTIALSGPYAGTTRVLHAAVGALRAVH